MQVHTFGILERERKVVELGEGRVVSAVGRLGVVGVEDLRENDGKHRRSPRLPVYIHNKQ